jgi:hypothetical protein
MENTNNQILPYMPNGMKKSKYQALLSIIYLVGYQLTAVTTRIPKVNCSKMIRELLPT